MSTLAVCSNTNVMILHSSLVSLPHHFHLLFTHATLSYCRKKLQFITMSFYSASTLLCNQRRQHVHTVNTQTNYLFNHLSYMPHALFTYGSSQLMNQTGNGKSGHDMTYQRH